MVLRTRPGGGGPPVPRECRHHGSNGVCADQIVESWRHRRKALKLASQIGILRGSSAGVLPQAFGPARGPQEATVTPG